MVRMSFSSMPKLITTVTYPCHRQKAYLSAQTGSPKGLHQVSVSWETLIRKAWRLNGRARNCDSMQVCLGRMRSATKIKRARHLSPTSPNRAPVLRLAKGDRAMACGVTMLSRGSPHTSGPWPRHFPDMEWRANEPEVIIPRC
jgi:hypothetical protein